MSKKKKKRDSVKSDPKPVKKIVIKTSWECENQCPRGKEKCIAGKNYLTNMVSNRGYNGIPCKY